MIFAPHHHQALPIIWGFIVLIYGATDDAELACYGCGQREFFDTPTDELTDLSRDAQLFGQIAGWASIFMVRAIECLNWCGVLCHTSQLCLLTHTPRLAHLHTYTRRGLLPWA